MGLFTSGQSGLRAQREYDHEKRLAYDKKMNEIKQMLDSYQESLHAYQLKLKSFEATEADHMAAVQVALDLTYVKEELEEMKSSQDDYGKKQDELIQTVGKLNHEIMESTNKNSSEYKYDIMNKLDYMLDTLQNGNKKLKTALGFSLFFNLLGAVGIIFVIINLLYWY
jgi:hypothetical protein